MKGILYMDASILDDPVLFEKGLTLVSEKRKEKVLRYQNSVPARLSLAAGILLRIAMEQYGVMDKMNEIMHEEFGKPYLKGTDFSFNLSHSGNYAICAYSDHRIGADIQFLNKNLPKYTDRILSESEKTYIMQLNEAERVYVFYELWARKESLIKWDGRGLRLPLQELSFVENNSIVDTLVFDGKKLNFKKIDIQEQYFCVVCDENEVDSFEMKEVDWNFLIKY